MAAKTPLQLSCLIRQFRPSPNPLRSSPIHARLTQRLRACKTSHSNTFQAHIRRYHRTPLLRSSQVDAGAKATEIPPEDGEEDSVPSLDAPRRRKSKPSSDSISNQKHFPNYPADPSIPCPPEPPEYGANTAAHSAIIPEYQIVFTCKPCGHRSGHRITKQGYHHGTVLIQCPQCKNRHVMSDHFKIFSDKDITVEDILKERGEEVVRGSLEDVGGTVEWFQGKGIRVARKPPYEPRQRKSRRVEEEEQTE